MNESTIIIAAGLGLAGFLYWKSKQDQAAALAAAQAAPGPGILGRAENTLKSIFSERTLRSIGAAGSAAVSTAVNVPLSAASSTAGVLSRGVSAVEHFIPHIF